jgi:hypothetical protein
MMFLGGAALGALDLLSSLTSQLEAKAGSKTDASSGGASFANALGSSSDATGTTQAAAADVASAGAGSGSGPFKSNVLAFLLARQEQQSGTQGGRPNGLSPLGEALFAKLDGDGNGSISKTELTSALGSGTDTSTAEKVFSKLDKSGDGSIDAKEFAGALQGRGGHHHHHGPPPAEGTQDLAALLDAQSKGAKSSTATNADGSSTTTITYADGSKVTLTTPAATPETGSAAVQPSAGTHNILETLIQLQAQHLGGGTTGTTAAGSAAA